MSGPARLGASRVGRTDWSFLVWAPLHDKVSLRVYVDGEERERPLRSSGDGYFSALATDVGDAPDYRYVLSDGATYADPASAWQPEGVHGPSRGFDANEFRWNDEGFSAGPLSEAVIYELHIGTFTPDGTFEAAIGRLDDLVELGVTAVEPMPVNAFPGVRNWGYDGAFPYAVQDSYGGPAGLQLFVDACHRRGLAVVLDVVYNHLGPEGTVLGSYGPYFTDVYATPWGEAVNVAESGSDEVRRYFTENALRWLQDFHIDGLRLDAIHGIVDPTASPFLRELTTAVAGLSADLGRHLFLIAESADNNPLVISPASVGGLGFDGQWSDDFHHALHVRLTGERDGYYADYVDPLDLVRAINDGFVYQGEHSAFRGRRHGAPSSGMSLDHFVVFTQDHDQVGNRAGAERLCSLVGPGAARLAAATLLLTPSVPMLFMGEEYAETAPFPYFVDHGDPALLEAVRQGRAAEFGRGTDTFDPGAPATYDKAKLDWSRRDSGPGREMLETYRELLGLRRSHRILTDPDVAQSLAALDGSLVTLLRQSDDAAAFVALNFGAEPVKVTPPEIGLAWQQVLPNPSEDPTVLGEHGFTLFIAGGSEGTSP